MGKIIAITNQKGGVGKTTTAVNLSSALGNQNKKVLVVDIDPQGNTTSGFGVSKRTQMMTTYDLLIGATGANEVVSKTDYKNVSIMPSHINLAAAEIELSTIANRESVLKQSLALVKNEFDYIILDCPPSLGLITINALTAADTILVPIQCEYYALEGLSQLMATVRQVKRMYNTLIEVEGVLLTMYDGRLNLTQQVVAEVKKFFPKKVFAATIPRSVRLSEAPSFGQPIDYYDKNSKGAQAYLALAKEVIKNNR